MQQGGARRRARRSDVKIGHADAFTGDRIQMGSETGCNSHAVGMGAVANVDTGFPAQVPFAESCPAGGGVVMETPLFEVKDLVVEFPTETGGGVVYAVPGISLRPLQWCSCGAGTHGRWQGVSATWSAHRPRRGIRRRCSRQPRGGGRCRHGQCAYVVRRVCSSLLLVTGQERRQTSKHVTPELISRHQLALSGPIHRRCGGRQHHREDPVAMMRCMPSSSGNATGISRLDRYHIVVQ